MKKSDARSQKKQRPDAEIDSGNPAWYNEKKSDRRFSHAAQIMVPELY